MMIKIIRYPLTRLILGIALLLGFVFAAGGAGGLVADNLAIENSTAIAALDAGFAIFAACLSYWVLVRLIEGRAVTELSARYAVPELFIGMLIGASFISSVMGVLYLAGFFEINGVRSVDVLVAPLIAAIATGFIEEIALRGVIFRIIEEWLGTWISLLFSAALFGALHLGNDNATLVAALAIALEAGILLAAVYMVTRRLWVVIGLHAGWNFTLGGVYGGAVSGFEQEGLLDATIAGPELITGGAFGVEASVVTIVIGLALALFFLFRAGQKNRFIAAPWRRAK
ncbi:MAG: CPBP family intramembrane metalloprotease [Alphaproteobacteria bacterium]|nr:CPBP family intramembrane metalloprotease [Alphaproteobacteria bacterium]